MSGLRTTLRCRLFGHKWRLLPFAHWITCDRPDCDHKRFVEPDHTDVQAVSAAMWEHHGDSRPRPSHYRGSMQAMRGYMEGPAPWNTPTIEEAATRFVCSERYSK